MSTLGLAHDIAVVQEKLNEGRGSFLCHKALPLHEARPELWQLYEPLHDRHVEALGVARRHDNVLRPDIRLLEQLRSMHAGDCLFDDVLCPIPCFIDLPDDGHELGVEIVKCSGAGLTLDELRIAAYGPERVIKLLLVERPPRPHRGAQVMPDALVVGHKVQKHLVTEHVLDQVSFAVFVHGSTHNSDVPRLKAEPRVNSQKFLPVIALRFD
mmetsp:Transcript_43704/g.126194  ORF Transcript_43704/g.126194 Transcript_43704/m.126194 type:complete len:212 (-) Transcript_43704:403-1038(-)